LFLIALGFGYLLVPKKPFMELADFPVFSFCSFVRSSFNLSYPQHQRKNCFSENVYGSLVNVIAVALGLAALQVCGAGAPVYGTALGVGFMSALFPSFLLNFLTCFGIYILIGSILSHLSAVVKGANRKSRAYN
jgi:hypothetical protein